MKRYNNYVNNCLPRVTKAKNDNYVDYFKSGIGKRREVFNC